MQIPVVACRMRKQSSKMMHKIGGRWGREETGDSVGCWAGRCAPPFRRPLALAMNSEGVTRESCRISRENKQ